jgi:hypothetical protein
MRRDVRLLLGVVGLACVIWLLQAAGRGPLGGPPLASATGAREWLANRDAATAAMALLRLVALGLAWYVLGATLLAAVAGHRVDAITVPALRRLVHGFAGITLTAGAATLAVSPGNDRPVAADAATMRRLPPVAPDAAVMRLVPDADVEWMYALDPAGTGGDEDGTATLILLQEAPAPQPASVPAPVDSHVTVVAGGSLWQISEEALTDAFDRPVSDREVAAYWRQVMELNRRNLVDPDNPDLLRPGQIITLPPIP